MSSISLPVASYQLRSHPASSSRLVNCFIEALPADAKTRSVLCRSHGIASVTTAGVGPITGMHAVPDYLFVISGGYLCRINSNSVVDVIGSVGSTTQSSIDMEHNIDTLVVVNTPNAYYCTFPATTFAQITDPDFTARGATDVEFLDNWLLFIQPDSGVLFGADLGSATSFDALNFVTAEGAPDNLVGLKVDHRQAILFGVKTIEIYENTGAAGFPFERAINGFIELGCLNGRTCAKLDNSVFWLADDYTVRRLDGITPVRVSTNAIEQALHNVTLDQGKAFSYSLEGHFFYVLIFPEQTFVYDVATQEWAERKSYGYDYWIPQNHAQAFNREYVGSSITNEIGYLDPTTYSEFGDIQVMEWTYQPIYAEGTRAFHDRLEIIMETGVGLSTGQGSNPTVMLAYSDDGAITWTNLPTRSAGAIGQYRWRVVWHRLGSSRMRVYRVSVSDPVKIYVTDTLVEVRSGRL